MIPLQLLAPARNIQIARTAILHGADAVYIGGPSHGARALAGNSLDDINCIVHFAHAFGAKVYVTLNTLIYENEIQDIESLVWEYWRIGVDALIVQDMGLLRMHLPPIALHASTQCDIRTVEKAKFLADCGFNQLVLPREFSLEQIQEVRHALGENIVLEAFVHGALCVSYSGDCQASCLSNGRSANRGECSQMCRMAYDLIDGKGNILLKDKYLLSLRDLCRIDNLEDLIEAGISSFKIEGRLKDENYVKNAVGAYRQALDKIILNNPQHYCSSSLGQCEYQFQPDLKTVFNRGFTSYFLKGRPTSPVKMVNLDTPKWIGQPIGTVLKCSPKFITADLHTQLSNGDGLGYFNQKNEFIGFRLNKVEGNKLFPASYVHIQPGTLLYRNRDIKRDALLAGNTSIRKISLMMELSLPLSITLTLIDKEISVTAVAKIENDDFKFQAARSPQSEARYKILSKLGGTNFKVEKYVDNVDPMVFIPASTLAQLKREAIELLEHNIYATHEFEYRGQEKDIIYPSSRLTYHDNVANSKAMKFYHDHGVDQIEPAIETASKNTSLKGNNAKTGLTVMTTRYCLRRELGACLKEKDTSQLSPPLYLRNKAATYLIDFDCSNCQMHLIQPINNKD